MIAQVREHDVTVEVDSEYIATLSLPSEAVSTMGGKTRITLTRPNDLLHVYHATRAAVEAVRDYQDEPVSPD
jgi:hypothetical protein